VAEQVLHSARSGLVALLWLSGHADTRSLLEAVSGQPRLTPRERRLPEHGSLVESVR